MAIDLNEAPPKGDQNGLLEHELLAIDLNEAPLHGDQDGPLEHELPAIDLNEAPLEGDQDGLLEHELLAIDLNEALVDQQDGVLPLHELHEYDEVNLHEGGENYELYPFDLNITLGDDEEEEGLHPDEENAMEEDVRTEMNAMEEYLADYGVYADVVDITFDQEELSDSDDEEDVPVDDPDFAPAVAETGLDIRLINQPTNSPDMNCLDLGFFASLQSLTYDTDSRNMDELINNVIEKFDKYDPTLLNRVYLTLQGCMIEVMKAGGGNKYPIPHMNKESLEELGILPDRLSCDRQLYESAVQSLAT